MMSPLNQIARRIRQLGVFFDKLQLKWRDRTAGKLSWDSPFWVFLVFFGIMLIQNRYVFIYHDDYGYASLSYAINIQSVRGDTYTLRQLAEFLVQHYKHWGGRILPLGAEILVLGWGVWPYRIVQSLVLTLILVTAYSFLCRYYRRGIPRWLIAFMLCCCYGLIDLELHRNGTYWASATVSYVWPFLALFVAASIHVRLEEGGHIGWRLPILGAMYLAVGSSQEQIGFLGIVFVSGLILAHLWFRKGRLVFSVDVLTLMCVVAGYAFLTLAPGNQMRLNSPIYASFNTLGLMDKVTSTLHTTITINLGRQNQAMMVVWVWLCAAVMWVFYCSGKRPRQAYFLAFVLCVFFGIVLTVAMTPTSFPLESWIYQARLSIGFLLFWGGFLCTVSLAVTLFSLEKGLYGLLALFAGGLLSQAMMLISPSLNWRSGLIFLFALFPVLAAMLAEVATEGRSQMFVKLALLTIFTAAAFNTFSILQGYAANSPVMESNDRILRHAARSIHNGATIQQIELNKLPNDRYAGEMPYTPGYDYINYWIREYYDLPPNVDLAWK